MKRNQNKRWKGRKDRYAILSEIALKTLREYVEKYKPEKWLFQGKGRISTFQPELFR